MKNDFLVGLWVYNVRVYCARVCMHMYTCLIRDPNNKSLKSYKRQGQTLNSKNRNYSNNGHKTGLLVTVTALNFRMRKVVEARVTPYLDCMYIISLH